MKAKLKKESDGNYTLILNNPKECPYSLPLLSKQNCAEIFGVTDVEKLAEKYCMHEPKNVKELRDVNLIKLGFRDGFNKAMELNKDKLFTEDDVNLAFVLGKNKDESRINKLINSKIQPTEIEVEIEMECKIGCEHIVFNGENSLCCGDKTPKLDSDGCLILK
jgi:hypothetical protein